MTDIKTAQALQRSILGPRRFMRHCGCIGHVRLYYPKRPWIYVDGAVSSCSFGFNNQLLEVPHLKTGWYNKETDDLVSAEQLKEAWDKARRQNGRVTIKDGAFEYWIAPDGDIGVAQLPITEGVGKEEAQQWVVDSMGTRWQPTMSEAFKKMNSRQR